ncbi:hypothetical protein HMPREF0591_0103 [Mycobacterium parascrofulaceum ATCC BAA-614]|uniref:Uncharacterized protein n=1 Tax=Mycobacterium parascrofulaceum ATCC BAA-614 TaxID=525368 RepID=D5P1Q9_9MYCO|nr:hypothetical protein HMPREF0591_0103 [Mycobacterium parascrofulaceum ATCC BAA-614]ETZ34970.1 gNAT family toxin-antitoxin system [Mycobacterium intracellulare MIN_052511_1280]
MVVAVGNERTRKGVGTLILAEGCGVVVADRAIIIGMLVG